MLKASLSLSPRFSPLSCDWENSELANREAVLFDGGCGVEGRVLEGRGPGRAMRGDDLHKISVFSTATITVTVTRRSAASSLPPSPSFLPCLIAMTSSESANLIFRGLFERVRSRPSLSARGSRQIGVALNAAAAGRERSAEKLLLL